MAKNGPWARIPSGQEVMGEGMKGRKETEDEFGLCLASTSSSLSKVRQNKRRRLPLTGNLSFQRKEVRERS
jgi:hypothetical protein